MIRTIIQAIISVIILLVGFSVQAQETVVVEKPVIVTPAPTVGECTTIAAHWEANVWISTQTVCKYENRPEGIAWVEDYWACIAYTSNGDCSTWELKPGHWVQTTQ